MRTEDVIKVCKYVQTGMYSSSWAAHAMQFAETLGDFSRVNKVTIHGYGSTDEHGVRVDV